ncbi:hypothetical protein ABT346_23120 [Micromonospora peucetia]|uniref:hypothetical protein n=1 Tax=Micromonospora peucetia TaxID=47871 RepID=UPI00332E9AB3
MSGIAFTLPVQRPLLTTADRERAQRPTTADAGRFTDVRAPIVPDRTPDCTY